MQYRKVACVSCGHKFEIGEHIQTYSCNECGHIHYLKGASAADLMAASTVRSDDPVKIQTSSLVPDEDRIGEAERYSLQAEFILHKLQANVSVYGANSGWNCPDPADVDLALKYIDRSIEIWPENPKYLNLKALFLMEGKGDREGGLAYLEKAAKLAPDDITIQDNLEKSKSQQQCFIATAAFAEGAWEVEELRHWRDTFLLKSSAGRNFVRLYYKLSPSVANALSTRTMVRKIARGILRPLARGVRRMRKF